MAEYSFARETLKRGLNIVKTIKPAVGDFSFSFSESGLTLFSYDNRRFVRAEVTPAESSDIQSGFSSDEFYIFIDKVAVFDTELDNILISVNESSLDLKASGGGQTRRSTLKKRSTKNRRPPVPKFPSLDFTQIQKTSFDELLRTVSCSASIKEGKTEDDMRTMQVHLYGNGYATSATRYHASYASVDGLNIETSIISADIPIIRSFLSKVSCETIGFAEDKDRIYFSDISTRTFLALSKIASDKPQFQSLGGNFNTHVLVDQDLFLRNLRWASMVVERTQRVTLRAHKSDPDTDSGFLVISFQKQEADGIPVTFVNGKNLEVDVPIDKLTHIVGYTEDKVSIKFGHSQNPSILEVSSQSDKLLVKSSHYLASMKAN